MALTNRIHFPAEGGIDQPLQCLAGELVQINSQWKLLKTKIDTLHWYVCRNGKC